MDPPFRERKKNFCNFFRRRITCNRVSLLSFRCCVQHEAGNRLHSINIIKRNNFFDDENRLSSRLVDKLEIIDRPI